MTIACNKPAALRPLTMSELLDVRAEQKPDAAAILAPGRIPLSYRRLRLHLDEVARVLGRFGIGANHRVAVAVPNGPEMAVAFASVAAFATCAPLNPAYQFDEFDSYLSDLEASALIVQSGTGSSAVAAAQKHSIPVVELTPLADGPAGIFSLTGSWGAAKASVDFARADDSALLLHTSGTTSRPKMISLTHAQLMTSADNIATGLQLTDRDCCLNVMPLFHIHGLVGALLSSIMAGAAVVCTQGFDPEKFFKWLKEFCPTWYTAVPTIHEGISACANAHQDVIDCHSLRLIRSCSAPLVASVARELEEIFGIPVIEAYGMTEAAHQISSNPLPPSERKAGSVGLATGTEVAVMDDKNNLLSRGEIGEIVIRGATIITAYANSALVDGESFTDGWFRTGDQGYLDTDGYVFLTGRLKEIINRGGEKISPREIEEFLLGHPAIFQAAVFRVPHPSLGDDIAAMIVLRHPSQLTESSIREYLLNRMVEFKVPSRIMIVDEIPKGATGKVNRTELSMRFSRYLPRNNDSPQSDLEETLAGIYHDVLRVETVGRSDNFFDLGGDSLRATQVINRVRALFKINLSMATIFRKPTVAELAGEIIRAIQGMDQVSLGKNTSP